MGICAILLWQISPENTLGAKNKTNETSAVSEHIFASLEAEIIQKINEERAIHDLPSLAIDNQLVETARQKSQDMIDQNYFSHQDPQNNFVWELLEKNGYVYKNAGENLARNFSNAQDIVSAWMQSESHRKNILEKNFEEVGIGIEKVTENGKDHLYVTALFGKKRLHIFAN